MTEIQKLFATPEPPGLGPEARAGVRSESELNAKLEAWFGGNQISGGKQQLIRALLLLWHDHLAASHAISQGIENADGSCLHAMMHRREPDYWNAKYWWRRVGAHPAFPEIARRVGALLAGSRRREESNLANQLLPVRKWDACAFVDLCEAAATDSRHVDLLREIQRIETQVLLESFLAR